MNRSIADQLAAHGFTESQEPACPIVTEFGGIHFHCPKCDNDNQATLYMPRPTSKPWLWYCDLCGWEGGSNELNEVQH